MIRFLVIALVSFVTLGACRESRAASAPTKVVITNSAVNARVAPLWIARDQGFYKKYGIETDLVLIRSGPLQVASLASGDSDVGYSGASTALGAAAGGADLKILASFTNKITYDLVARPGIKTPADLRGKRVGVQAIGGTVWMGAMLGLEQLGLEPSRDRINILVIGDQAVANPRSADRHYRCDGSRWRLQQDSASERVSCLGRVQQEQCPIFEQRGCGAPNLFGQTVLYARERSKGATRGQRFYPCA